MPLSDITSKDLEDNLTAEIEKLSIDNNVARAIWNEFRRLPLTRQASYIDDDQEIFRDEQPSSAKLHRPNHATKTCYTAHAAHDNGPHTIDHDNDRNCPCSDRRRASFARLPWVWRRPWHQGMLGWPKVARFRTYGPRPSRRNGRWTSRRRSCHSNAHHCAATFSQAAFHRFRGKTTKGRSKARRPDRDTDLARHLRHRTRQRVLRRMTPTTISTMWSERPMQKCARTTLTHQPLPSLSAWRNPRRATHRQSTTPGPARNREKRRRRTSEACPQNPFCWP